MASCNTNVGGLERLGCFVLGGFLLAKGVLTRRASRTFVGGLFICRALSGHCYAYRALDLDTRTAGERGQG